MSAPAAVKDAARARQIIIGLNACIGVLRVHSNDNEAANQALARLSEAFEALFGERDEVELVYHGGHFFVNAERIRVPNEFQDVFAGLGKDLEARSVGALIFRHPPSPSDLAVFVRSWEEAARSDGTLTATQFIERRLKAQSVTGIGILEANEQELLEVAGVEGRVFVRDAYFRAIDGMADLYTEARKGRALTIRRAKRIVQTFVDVLTAGKKSHTDLLILLTEIKNWRGYLPNHSVNTCILALGLGRTIGLDRAELREVGVAALLADIGNAKLSRKVLDSDGPLDPAGLKAVAGHPARGVPMLARAEELDPGVIRAVIASLEHHRGIDGRGYPKSDRDPGLCARIIAIADRYDAMTSPRPYRTTEMTPPEAIETLAQATTTGLDPLFVKLFVHFMGTVPAGSVVVLESGELALVLSPAGRNGRSTMRVAPIDSSGSPGAVRDVPSSAMSTDPTALAKRVGAQGRQLAAQQAAAMMR